MLIKNLIMMIYREDNSVNPVQLDSQKLADLDQHIFSKQDISKFSVVSVNMLMLIFHRVK